MKKELAQQFNREVDSYRKALLWYARKCDWEEFRAKAGRLFDYVESIEFAELERRFFATFSIILAVLIMAVVALLSVNFEVRPELMRLKNACFLSAIAASSFELYFYINYRKYVSVRTGYYNKRRESFIKNMEQDFLGYASRQESRA